MELIYHDSQKLDEKEKLLREKRPEVTDITLITSEEAEQFDTASQKLLAEICYSKISKSFDD